MEAEIIGTSGFGLAAVVALLAGFMRGFVGVGSGMLMAPVFAILFGPLQTVGTVIMLDAFVTAQLLPSVHRLIEGISGPSASSLRARFRLRVHAVAVHPPAPGL